MYTYTKLLNNFFYYRVQKMKTEDVHAYYVTVNNEDHLMFQCCMLLLHQSCNYHSLIVK